jgi:hypothetical protein
MSIRPKIPLVISSQLPEFIREDYPTFVAFLEAYYEFLNQQDVDLYKIKDIDKTLDNFLEYFKNELAPRFIDQPSIDKRFLLSNIKDQHLAKGSEASFKLLFRLMFNKNVIVEYPGRQLLRASDGKWNQDVSIFAYVNAGNPDDVVGRLVDIVTPNKTIRVLVDRRQDVEVEVDRVVTIAENVYEFYIDRRFFGNIAVGDKLRYAGIFDATILSTTSNVQIVQRGKNFKVGQLYNIKNGEGAGSILKIKSVNTEGGITAAEFVKYGIGYNTDFTATLLAQQGQTITGTGQTALSVSTVSNVVTSIEVTDGGSGYSNNPVVVLSGGGFTSAATIGTVTVVGGVIVSIEIETSGSGYVTPPEVIITDSTGTGAEAVSTLGIKSIYTINESTSGFVEQGYVNLADYAQDIQEFWLPNRTYASGTEVYFQNRLYTVTSAGTTGIVPPTHTSGSESNGSLTLEYTRVHGAAWEGTYSGNILREFFFDSQGIVIEPDEPAIIRVSLGPLTKYPGYYVNNDGFLDDAIYIQDSKFYQSYSYLIKIDEKLESYKSAVKTLIHPAGLALFGEYDIRNEIDLSVSLESMIKFLTVSARDTFALQSNITAKDFGKLLEDEVINTDVHQFLLSKPLEDDEEIEDTSTTLFVSKPLSSILPQQEEVTTFDFDKSLEDSQLIDEGITAKDFGKLLEESTSISDSASLDSAKYISEDFSTEDSGGELWLNPYDNPYPEANAYFLNDSGNYTAGETAFAG